MKHLLTAVATATLLASAPALAQSSPDTAVPTPTQSAPPSATTPAEPAGCVPGQVLQANGQPCPAIGSGSTAQTPVTPSPSVLPGPAPSTAAQSPATLPNLSPPSAPSDVAIAGSASGTTFIDRQGEDEMLASNLMGKSVENPGGDKIGSVKDILFDDNGQMTAIIIGVGGFLGLGEKSVAISFDAVTPGKDANGTTILTASVDRDAVDRAQGFMTVEDIKAKTPSSATIPSSAPSTP